MFVGLEAMEGGLLLLMDLFDIFSEIHDFGLKLLPLTLELFNFFTGVHGLIFHSGRIVFLTSDILL